MYNRYIRNDQGGYSRIPEEEPHRDQSRGGPRESPPISHTEPPHHHPDSPPENHHPPPPPPPPEKDAERFADGVTGFLRHILDQFHLDNVDTGDLLLLAILFFLFREDADEELLFAMGLLLIL